MKSAAVPRRRRPKFLSKPTSPKPESPGEDQYRSKVLVRALEVLDAFHSPSSAFSLSEISARTGLPESSLFRILVTLCSRGYLLQDESGAYVLARKVASGKTWERAEHIRRVAHPKLQQLVSQFEETASLAFLFSDHIRVVDTVESFHDIRMINKISRIVPPNASSLAKSIIAFQERTAIDQILEVCGVFRRTEKTLVDRQAIYAEFEAIRARGYAFDREETTLGGICVGGPIVSPSGKVESSISIATPLIRFSPERERLIVPALLQATQEVASALDRF